MSTDVLLIRHTEKEEGSGDPGLTPSGAHRAQRAEMALVRRRPAAIVSSPLRRALETAHPLARLAGLEVRIDERLRERMNWPSTISERTFVRRWRTMDLDRDWVPNDVPDARSSRITGRELLSATAAHAVPERTVILFTHGGAILDALRTLLDEDTSTEISEHLPHEVPNVALTRLTAAGSDHRQLRELATTDYVE